MPLDPIRVNPSVPRPGKLYDARGAQNLAITIFGKRKAGKHLGAMSGLMRIVGIRCKNPSVDMECSNLECIHMTLCHVTKE